MALLGMGPVGEYRLAVIEDAIDVAHRVLLEVRLFRHVGLSLFFGLDARRLFAGEYVAQAHIDIRSLSVVAQLVLVHHQRGELDFDVGFIRHLI